MINITNELQKAHFLTDEINFKIIKFLLSRSDGVSFKDVADHCKISKGIAKYRLQKFTELYLCLVNIETPIHERQKLTKTYKLLFMLRPKLRSSLNNFVEYIDEVCMKKIRITND